MDQGKPLLASDSPLVDFNAICQKVRAAVEPARAHAVSLHDELGDVLWLSESSMGPDEHNAVREAAEAFTKPNASPVLAFDLGDSRSAVMVRAVNARRSMVGVVMIVMDTRIVAQGAAKLMTPKLQRALLDFAAMRPDRGQPTAASEPVPTAPTPPPRSSNRSTASRPAAAPAGMSRTAAATEPPPRSAPASQRSAPAPQRSAPSPQRSAPASQRSAPAPQSSAPASQRSAPAAARAAASRPESAPVQTSSATMPFSAGPRSIAAQVQQIAARTPARPVNSARAAAAPEAAPAAAPAAPSSPAATASDPAAVPTLFEDGDKPQGRNGVAPEIDRLHAALRKSPIALHVQRLIPLSKGSQLKRYEVLLRSGLEASPNAAPQAMLKAAVDNGLGSMIDRRVLSELISWLIRNPEVCQVDEVMFSVNLTSTALHDEHFIKFVELCLSKSSLPKATIAFEVDASTALTLADKIRDVADALNRLGCPLILDDFALRTECFDLLRLPGVRYVKLASEITARMRTDKVSQAAITGVVQMARVLGMHTVAKRTETAAEQEWLTALGVDFVQSNAISPPVAIDTLTKPQHFKI
jgi:EAL domain-containing protein (putative c-di-GMP-specific phosphodiesterase class I)